MNNHLAIFAAFLAWCVGKGYADDNVARGLKLPNKTRASRRRKSFTDQEIEQVFGYLEAENPPRSARYWLPLIMLYTGARPEEVAQLRVVDVREVEMAESNTLVTCFDFFGDGEGQRIKNDASRRLVPVHVALWQHGLAQLLDTRGGHASERDRLFPALQCGANGRFAEAPSRWFNETWLRDRKGICDPKKVLYSLRHTVATKLKHGGVSEAMISEMTIPRTRINTNW